MSDKRWFSNDRFNTLAVITIVIASCLVAINIYFASNYSDRSELLIGDVQYQTMKVASKLAVGQFTADYGWTQAYRLWLEMDTIGYNAANYEQWEILPAYDAVRDRVRELSPLLQAPYFDPAVDTQPNISAYESDIYVVEVALERQKLDDMTLQRNAWGSKSGDLWFNVRLLSIVLTLLGLIAAFFEDLRTKYMLLAVSVGMILYVMPITVNAINRDVPERSVAAMEHYADGMGLYHQQRYDEAVAAFSQAIELDPEYIEAYVQRGFAYRDNYDFTGDAANLTSATADFKKAVEAGRTEVNVIGQLAELYYLNGQFEDAMQVSEQGAAVAPELIHTLDLGRSQLASGDFSGAEATYQKALDTALQQFEAAQAAGTAPAVSFWRALDIGFLELDALIRCAETQVCEGSPAYDQLPANLAATARPLSTRLKNFSASLDVLGRPPTAETSPATVQPFQFEADEGLTINENTFLYGMHDLTVRLEAEGIPDNAIILVKAYLNDREYPPLRQVFNWSESNELALTIGEDTGTYVLQLYVDGLLVQEGEFSVVYEE